MSKFYILKDMIDPYISARWCSAVTVCQAQRVENEYQSSDLLHIARDTHIWLTWWGNIWISIKKFLYRFWVTWINRNVNAKLEGSSSDHLRGFYSTEFEMPSDNKWHMYSGMMWLLLRRNTWLLFVALYNKKSMWLRSLTIVLVTRICLFPNSILINIQSCNKITFSSLFTCSDVCLLQTLLVNLMLPDCNVLFYRSLLLHQNIFPSRYGKLQRTPKLERLFLNNFWRF